MSFTQRIVTNELHAEAAGVYALKTSGFHTTKNATFHNSDNNTQLNAQITDNGTQLATAINVHALNDASTKYFAVDAQGTTVTGTLNVTEDTTLTNATITGNAIVTGTLEVQGGTTSISSNELNIGDAHINLLHTNHSIAGKNSGILTTHKVGQAVTLPNEGDLKYNGDTNTLQYTHDPTTGSPLPVAGQLVQIHVQNGDSLNASIFVAASVDEVTYQVVLHGIDTADNDYTTEGEFLSSIETFLTMVSFTPTGGQEQQDINPGNTNLAAAVVHVSHMKVFHTGDIKFRPSFSKLRLNNDSPLQDYRSMSYNPPVQTELNGAQEIAVDETDLVINTSNTDITLPLSPTVGHIVNIRNYGTTNTLTAKDPDKIQNGDVVGSAAATTFSLNGPDEFTPYVEYDIVYGAGNTWTITNLSDALNGWW